MHLLTSCDFNSDLRDRLYNELSEFIPSFDSMTDYEKFVFLITCYNGDADVCQLVGDFVYISFKQRNN